MADDNARREVALVRQLLDTVRGCVVLVNLIRRSLNTMAEQIHDLDALDGPEILDTRPDRPAGTMRDLVPPGTYRNRGQPQVDPAVERGVLLFARYLPSSLHPLLNGDMEEWELTMFLQALTVFNYFRVPRYDGLWRAAGVVLRRLHGAQAAPEPGAALGLRGDIQAFLEELGNVADNTAERDQVRDLAIRVAAVPIAADAPVPPPRGEQMVEFTRRRNLVTEQAAPLMAMTWVLMQLGALPALQWHVWDTLMELATLVEDVHAEYFFGQAKARNRLVYRYEGTERPLIRNGTWAAKDPNKAVSPDQPLPVLIVCRVLSKHAKAHVTGDVTSWQLVWFLHAIRRLDFWGRTAARSGLFQMTRPIEEIRNHIAHPEIGRPFDFQRALNDVRAFVVALRDAQTTQDGRDVCNSFISRVIDRLQNNFQDTMQEIFGGPRGEVEGDTLHIMQMMRLESLIEFLAGMVDEAEHLQLPPRDENEEDAEEEEDEEEEDEEEGDGDGGDGEGSGGHGSPDDDGRGGAGAGSSGASASSGASGTSGQSGASGPSGGRVSSDLARSSGGYGGGATRGHTEAKGAEGGGVRSEEEVREQLQRMFDMLYEAGVQARARVLSPSSRLEPWRLPMQALSESLEKVRGVPSSDAVSRSESQRSSIMAVARRSIGPAKTADIAQNTDLPHRIPVREPVPEGDEAEAGAGAAEPPAEKEDAAPAHEAEEESSAWDSEKVDYGAEMSIAEFDEKKWALLDSGMNMLQQLAPYFESEEVSGPLVVLLPDKEQHDQAKREYAAGYEKYKAVLNNFRALFNSTIGDKKEIRDAVLHNLALMQELIDIYIVGRYTNASETFSIASESTASVLPGDGGSLSHALYRSIADAVKHIDFKDPRVREIVLAMERAQPGRIRAHFSTLNDLKLRLRTGGASVDVA